RDRRLSDRRSCGQPGRPASHQGPRLLSGLLREAAHSGSVAVAPFTAPQPPFTAARKTPSPPRLIFPRMEDTLNRQTQFGGAKLIIGIFFVIHGLLLAADTLGLLTAWDYLRYWPAVILLLGIYRLWQPGRQLAGAILAVVGGSLLALNAGWM